MIQARQPHTCHRLGWPGLPLAVALKHLDLAQDLALPLHLEGSLRTTCGEGCACCRLQRDVGCLLQKVLSSTGSSFICASHWESCCAVSSELSRSEGCSESGYALPWLPDRSVLSPWQIRYAPLIPSCLYLLPQQSTMPSCRGCS